MSEFKTIETEDAPKAIGPYSQATQVGNMIFCSGQICLDPSTQEMISGGIAEQTERVCMNVEAVLKAAGSDLSKVVKTTCLLKDMSQFAQFNEIYGKYFGNSKPARATFGVAALPKDALVEIEVIALA